MAPSKRRVVVTKEVAEKVAAKRESLEIGSVLNVALTALLQSPSASSVELRSRKVLAKAEAKVVGMLTSRIHNWTIFTICVRSTISTIGWKGESPKLCRNAKTRLVKISNP